MSGRDSILDAVRAAVREEARALGLLGNGDRERLIRMEERHRTVDRRVAAIEGKIDALAGELKERDERAETRFVTRAEASRRAGRRAQGPLDDRRRRRRRPARRHPAGQGGVLSALSPAARSSPANST